MTLAQAQTALDNAKARRVKRDEQMTTIVNSIQVIDGDIARLTKLIELLQASAETDILLNKYQTP